MVVSTKTKQNSINPEDYEFYAIEINLRVCGTTHPMLTLKLLTEGFIVKRLEISFLKMRKSTILPPIMFVI
jgi:hypothetical protein